MKDIKTTLLKRTSIRKYTEQPIPGEVMQFIYDAVRNTPTSFNGQQFSVIDITEPATKNTLAEITGQKQIKECAHFLVFCSDYNKARLLALSKGLEFPDITDTIDGTLIGVIDASLAMMSAIVAAQACWLGTNCIGYLRTADPARIAEILNLPKGVFVVCGLTMGYPNQNPDLKPREPEDLIFHKEKYRDDNNRIVEEMTEFDDMVKLYNATRTGTKTDNDWIAHMVYYYSASARFRILDYLREQGYDINR